MMYSRTNLSYWKNSNSWGKLQEEITDQEIAAGIGLGRHPVDQESVRDQGAFFFFFFFFFFLMFPVFVGLCIQYFLKKNIIKKKK